MSSSSSSIGLSARPQLLAGQRFGHFRSMTAINSSSSSSGHGNDNKESKESVIWPPIGLDFGQQAHTIATSPSISSVTLPPSLSPSDQPTNKRARTHSDVNTTESSLSSSPSVGDDVFYEQLNSEQKKFEEDRQREWNEYTSWSDNNSSIIRGIQHAVFLL
jgi:hypothetical protein